MNTFKNLVLFTFFALLSFSSCKNESSTAKDAARESLATSVSSTDPKVVNTTPKEEPKPVGPTTVMEFEELTYDFGEVMEGEKVVHVYKFKNTGNEPLIISNVKASCGCTAPYWPKEPIAAGKSGEIKVQFDSKNKGKVGGSVQSKKVTVIANTDPVNTYLTIKGKVNKDAEAATPES